MIIYDIFNEIKSAMQNIIKNGLSIEDKYPIMTNTKITWVNQMNLSKALKNIPYEDKYKILEKDKNFNLKMLDGALIQMMYEFNSTGRDLISHRLAYFPSIKLERYDDAYELYEKSYLVNSEFHDVREKDIIAFPIRFDYNNDDKLFCDVEHPYSHASFGEYENCRIPVCSPLTPSIFLNFILRNFYSYAFKKNDNFCKISKNRLNCSITKNEKNILHFNIV